MANDLWRTPDWLYNFCSAMFGPFDVDLAASQENAKCRRYITKEINALYQDWHTWGSNGFCNPPYSDLAPWLAKAKDENRNHSFNSTFVVPTFNGEAHWYDNVYELAASHVINIYGRVAFLDEDGRPIAGNRQGTQIVHYGLADRANPLILHTKRDWLIKNYS